MNTINHVITFGLDGTANNEQYAKLLESRSEHIQSLIEGDEKSASLAKDRADALEKQIEADQKLIAKSPEDIASAERIAKTHEETASAVNRRGVQTHQVEETSEAATARRRLLERGQGGHGAPETPAEARQRQQIQDEGIEALAAQDTGSMAGLHAADAIARGRTIVNNLHGQHASQSAQQMSEIHQILDQITGYLENHSASVQSQSGNLRDIQIRLSNLESRADHGTGSY
jgi:hypothetical protein